MSNIWYSYKGIPYKGENPPYYDLSELKWYQKLLAQLPGIQKETIALLSRKGLKVENYFNPTIVEGQSTWQGLSFMFWNQPASQVIEQGHKVFSYFKDIPGLVSVSVSMLHRHTHIKPHYGDTDGIYRLHIPIVIPAPLPQCGLKVGGISKGWASDEIIAFCDAHLHEAWNNTDHVRIVIIADVVKEEFLSNTKEIGYNVRSLLQLQKLFLKYKWLGVLPGPAKGVLRHILKWRIKSAS